MGRYKRKKLLRETRLESRPGNEKGMMRLNSWKILAKSSMSIFLIFNMQEYFAPERYGLLLGLMNFFIGTRNLPPKKELTIGDLERAVSAGKLDAFIIGQTKNRSVHEPLL